MNGRAIRAGDRVTLHYRLSSGGHVVADTFGDAPETFVVGAGDIDPRLELALTGLSAGDHRRLQLAPWLAFGEREEARLQTLPRAEFQKPPELDQIVEFGLPNGDTWLGTVVAIDDDSVRVDFNHPLAGLPVEFEVQIIEVE